MNSSELPGNGSDVDRARDPVALRAEPDPQDGPRLRAGDPGVQEGAARDRRRARARAAAPAAGAAARPAPAPRPSPPNAKKKNPTGPPRHATPRGRPRGGAPPPPAGG